MPPRLASWLAVLALASPAAAQLSNIAGSGCPGSGFVATGGSVQVGQTLFLGYSCQSALEFPQLLTGVEITPTNLPTSLTCGGSPCAVALQVAGSVSAAPGQTAVLQLAIPNNPTLVGQCFAAQGACFNPSGCSELSVGLRFCLLP